MPISGDKLEGLSLQLISGIENFVKGFFLEKKISQSEIPEVFDCNAVNRLARNLGLNLKAGELAGELVIVSKETPLEIINRIATEAVSSPPSCEADLLY